MKNRIIIRVIVTFLLVLLVSGMAYAIGVTPGRKTLDFEAGLQDKVEITILNNDKKDMNALIYVEGELNDSVI